MDFDPRDFDSRDDERHSHEPSRGSRGSSGDHDRDHDWRQPDARMRDRDDGDERSLGRGPGSDRQGSGTEERDRDHDPRWTERDTRERDPEIRDSFTRHVHLPRGRDRELVHDRDREYTLRGSELRTLATVGAFRVVSSRDLRDHDGSPADPRSGDLRHLREQGLIETTRVPGYRDHAVSLTKDGRRLLESHRDLDREHLANVLRGAGTRARTGTRPPGLSRVRTGRGPSSGPRCAHRARRPRPRAEERVSALAPRARQGPRRLRRPPRSHAR
jgi:DNA-binding MarR family transcriptional regulator